MTSRCANSSIKGYFYQFLHTIYDILNQEDDKINIIEGIEDLDICSSEESKLCQYKYHEEKHFTNSVVGKPIGLMYNHFLNNEQGTYVYKLILYISEELPIIDEERLTRILSMKASQDYIDELNKQYCGDNLKIQSFLKRFSCIKSEKFSALEERVIKKIIDIFNVSEDEARFTIISNALKIIMNFAVKSNYEDRTISTKEFKTLINSKKQSADIAFCTRLYGETKATQMIKTRMRDMNIKPNTHDYIFYISDTTRMQLSNLILEIAKKFYYKGNKNDYRPVTFIIQNMPNIKNSIVNTMQSNGEVIIFNDGYEDYGFCYKIFNQKPITTSRPLSGKVNNVNFNFKIISLNTYQNNKEKIDFENPVMFSIGESKDEIINDFEKIYYINVLSNEKIISILG